MRRKGRWIDTAPICIRFLKFMEDGGQVFFFGANQEDDGEGYGIFYVKSSDKGLEENPYKNY